MNQQILRLPQVIERTGRSRSSIYADIQRGAFPEPIHIGQRARGWLEADITDWLEARIRYSRKDNRGEVYHEA